MRGQVVAASVDSPRPGGWEQPQNDIAGSVPHLLDLLGRSRLEHRQADRPRFGVGCADVAAHAEGEGTDRRPRSRASRPLGGRPWSGPWLVPVMIHAAVTRPSSPMARLSIVNARSGKAANSPVACSAVAGGPRPAATVGSARESTQGSAGRLTGRRARRTRRTRSPGRLAGPRVLLWPGVSSRASQRTETRSRRSREISTRRRPRGRTARSRAAAVATAPGLRGAAS